MNDAANETRAVENTIEHNGPSGRIGSDEQLITLTEAAWHARNCPTLAESGMHRRGSKL